jgi:hypothetical protein
LILTPSFSLLFVFLYLSQAQRRMSLQLLLRQGQLLLRCSFNPILSSIVLVLLSLPDEPPCKFV